MLLAHGVLFCKRCKTSWNRNYNAACNMLRCMYCAYNGEHRPIYLSWDKKEDKNKDKIEEVSKKRKFDNENENNAKKDKDKKEKNKESQEQKDITSTKKKSKIATTINQVVTYDGTTVSIKGDFFDLGFMCGELDKFSG